MAEAKPSTGAYRSSSVDVLPAWVTNVSDACLGWNPPTGTNDLIPARSASRPTPSYRGRITFGRQTVVGAQLAAVSHLAPARRQRLG